MSSLSEIIGLDLLSSHVRVDAKESADGSSDMLMESSIELDLIMFKETDDVYKQDESTAKTATTVTIAEECLICGDTMLPSCDIYRFIKGQADEPERRALSCLSGHKFCVSCWSSHLSVQISDNSIGCIPCPAYKCGEILDIEWAPVLLKSQEQVNRLLSARLRHIVDYAGLKCCQIDNCNVIVHLPPDSRVASAGAFSTPTTHTTSSDLVPHNIPLSGLCNQGHLFCISCSQVAHSPCTCTDFLQWQQQVQEQMESTQVKDGANGDEIANALWVAANTKRCPRCSTPIEKDEGCNHMRQSSTVHLQWISLCSSRADTVLVVSAWPVTITHDILLTNVHVFVL